MESPSLGESSGESREWVEESLYRHNMELCVHTRVYKVLHLYYLDVILTTIQCKGEERLSPYCSWGEFASDHLEGIPGRDEIWESPHSHSAAPALILCVQKQD